MAEDRADDDGVLTPDDLDVRDDERVVELDENRFFVSTGGNEADATADAVTDLQPTESRGPSDRPGKAAETDSTRGSGTRDPPATPDGKAPSGRALPESLDGVDGHYAIAAAVRTDAGVSEHVVDSNNVAETFEAFLRWYADRVGDGRATQEEVLEILLAESDLDLDL